MRTTNKSMDKVEWNFLLHIAVKSSGIAIAIENKILFIRIEFQSFFSIICFSKRVNEYYAFI